MSKDIKIFITRDDFIVPSNKLTSPVYELSEISSTYSKSKEIVYPSEHPTYAIHSFDHTLSNSIDNSEANFIIRAIKEFVDHATSLPTTSKQTILSGFLTRYNSLFPDEEITLLEYNTIIPYNGIRVPDYISFTMLGINCSIWLSEATFNKLYPAYDIGLVLPFENFETILPNTQEMLTRLEDFDPILFNERIETNKDSISPTVTRIVNVPFKVPNTNVTKKCYFGFNIYGINGNHEHILRLELHRHLTEDLGLNPTFVEERFPTILNVNEFFIVPRWDDYAIPSQVGQMGINSQVVKRFNPVNDMVNYVKIHNDENFFISNTYNVPHVSNNILLTVLNGLHSEDLLRDFKDYFDDIITVSSTHPDFNRMSTRTQRFLSLTEHLLIISDADSKTDLFNKIISSTEYNFNITERAGITYVTFRYEDHQYYVVPRYEYLDKK